MTKTAKVNDIVRDWVVLDAKDKVFGRLITEIAVLLRGNTALFTPLMWIVGILWWLSTLIRLNFQA